MCKHERLEYHDTISATTSITIENFGEGDELSCNNEYGSRIEEEVSCIQCEKRWKINGREPKFVAEFVEKISKMRG